MPRRHLPPDGGYFPAGAVEFEALYEPQLRAMAEPAMSSVAGDVAEAYRFTWVRTFHPAVAVRVELRTDGAVLEAVVLSGQGGYEPGEVRQRVARRLSADEWRRVEDAIARARFWELELEVDLGFDGSGWLLEGVRGGEYRAVEQCSPKPDSADAEFRRLCLSLLESSGLEVQPAY